MPAFARAAAIAITQKIPAASGRELVVIDGVLDCL
jgi:hypothetical protein